ncbi:hypothetical protein BASA81_001559 [Batrachochytrium salamandrivorans]|nr:hypothetical protein BASA81_001559 [Batrachochytrium salamandrivorans]
MRITGMALVSLRGEAIAHRSYSQQDLQPALDAFRAHITSRTKRAESSPPVLLLDGTTFVFTKHSDVFAVAMCFAKECNPVLALELLTNVWRVLVEYLGEGLGEAELRNNFFLVLELLEEMVDYGLPQTLQTESLRALVVGGVPKPPKLPVSPRSVATAAGLADQITGKVEWRRTGITYKHNAFYVDLVESINCLIGKEGEVVRSDVVGEIKIKSCLSGMPECKLMLNDRLRGNNQSKVTVQIEDMSFHRCVRLGKFDLDRSIVFTPPDGAFDLLKYRISDNVQPPFRVLVLVDQSNPAALAYSVRVHANFPLSATCLQFSLRVPLPPATLKVSALLPSAGLAKHEPTEGAVVWRIRQMSGGAEVSLRLVVDLPHKPLALWWSRPGTRSRSLCGT